MLTEKKRLIFLKKLFPILIISICLLMSIGYATVNDVILSVEGDAVAKVEENISVTEVYYAGSSSADTGSSSFSASLGTNMKANITLDPNDNNSFVKYIVTFRNNQPNNYEFSGIEFIEEFYDNPDIIVDVGNSISAGTVIESGEQVDIDVIFKYKEGVTPSELNNVLNAYIKVEFIPCAVLMVRPRTNDGTFIPSNYVDMLQSITFEDKIDVPDNALGSWDIGANKNGDVIAYVVNANDPTNSNSYKLYIQSNTQLYANENMSYWFSSMYYLKTINSLDLLDTINVKDMSYMFNFTGYYSNEFSLDLSSFDTSSVTNMEDMFSCTGHNSTSFYLNLGEFDTSSVTNFYYTFREVGYNANNWSFELTIRNPGIKYYDYYYMFDKAAVKANNQIIVNYTNETSELVDSMLLQKSSNSNVVKGWNVDVPITFTIEGTTYNAYEGMTWEQWINSDLYVDGLVSLNEDGEVMYEGDSLASSIMDYTMGSDVIGSGVDYIIALPPEVPI